MTSLNSEGGVFPAPGRPSLASTPCRVSKEAVADISSSGALQADTTITATTLLHASNTDSNTGSKRITHSLRHSLGHLALQGKHNPVWISQRTSHLFELLTRPALLFTPSLGIRLPFRNPLRGGIGQIDVTPVRLSVRKRNQLVDPDPCLLSVDGLLDCLYVASSLVDQVCYDCRENEEEEDDSYGRSPTLVTAQFFRKRIKPALARLKKLRIKLTDFRLGKFIGRGACGVVRVVHEVAPPYSVYAMKSQFKGAWLHHDPEGAQLMLERTVLAQAAAIQNPWLPHLHYAFQDDKHLHLVMDYEPGGDLYIFLSKVGRLMDSDMIAFYTAEAVAAINSLHRMGYIHCDLKPENFAIERSGHLKLLDFGSAIRLDSDGKCICPTMVGTKEYLNIELLRQRGRHNEEPLLVGPEYDYWAIGVLLYELFYGQTPFFDEDEDAMMQKIMDYKRTLKFPAGVAIPDDAVQLIRSLITTPSKRLTYEGVMRHPFFKKIDFATLRNNTPPYLPPVGELDDVSNFSGGGNRTRDEAILDVSTNHTFSPSRQGAGDNVSDSTSIMGTTVIDRSEQPQPAVSRGQADGEDEENVDPNDVSSPPPQQPEKPVLSESEVKRKAIQEAAAVPVHEEFDEIEDMEWEGSECVRDLPFIGYSFTPGLVLLRAPGGQTGTTGTSHRPSLAVSRLNSTSGAHRDPIIAPLNRNPSGAAQFSQKLNELQSVLDKQLRLFSPERVSLIQNLQERLKDAIDDPSNWNALKETMSDAISTEEKLVLGQLTRHVDDLRGENQKLSGIIATQRSALDKIDVTLSRLHAFPDDFAEADLVDLRCSLGLQQQDDKTPSNGSETDAVQQLISLVHTLLKRALAREVHCRAAVETANLELREAWDASKQQMGTLDTMLADQRQLRECEHRLNQEIQTLTQKLTEGKHYHRDLRKQCTLNEDKYYAVRDKLEESEILRVETERKLRDVSMQKDAVDGLLRESNLQLDRLKNAQDHLILTERFTKEIETLQMQLRVAELERDAIEQRELTACHKLATYENQLNGSRHEISVLRDGYERLKQTTAEMEASLCNREDLSDFSVVHRQLVDSHSENHQLMNELSCLKAQLEKFRVSNTQFVEQRDEANQHAMELETALEQEKQASEAARLEAQDNMFRLTTTTKQQGKLIDHLCGLLPPEHRPPRIATLTGEGTETPRRPVDTKRSVVKLLGHAALRTDVRRPRSTTRQLDDTDTSENGVPTGGGGGGPLITAASAFFGRRRGTAAASGDRTAGSPEANGRAFTKQPSRLQRFVRQSKLRLKRRTIVAADRGTESDQVFTETEEDDSCYRTICPVRDADNYYNTDDDDDDEGHGLPLDIGDSSGVNSRTPIRSRMMNNHPMLPPPPSSSLRPNDSTDDNDSLSSLSSGPSTTSSAPSGQVGSMPGNSRMTSARWREHRGSKKTTGGGGGGTTRVVGWGDNSERIMSRQLLKQLSKVLGKGKTLSANAGNTPSRPGR